MCEEVNIHTFIKEESLILAYNLGEIQASSTSSDADTGHEYKGRVNLARNAENAQTIKLPTVCDIFIIHK